MRYGPSFFRGLIQAAGFHDLAEALSAVECGITCLGLPLRLPVHVQDLTEADAAQLVAGLPQAVTAVCITYETDPAAVADLCRSLGVDIVQLHADATPRQLAALRALAPELTVIKSCIVHGDADRLLRSMAAAADHVDAFITDTFDPATGATGATGRTHDWAVSREIVRRSPRPVILAGGLHPGNVADAIRAVRPHGVDAHTGLEDPATGRKDPGRMRVFVAAARECWKDSPHAGV